MKKKTIYPHLIIKGLAELGYKKQFLNFVKPQGQNFMLNGYDTPSKLLIYYW